MKVVWSDFAISNLNEISSYYTKKESIELSKNIIKEILTATKSLSLFPNVGRIVPEYDDNSIREIFIYKFKIIYEIKINKIEILFIAHMSKNFKK